MTDDEIITLCREAGFSDSQWKAMTFEDGPYSITTPTEALRNLAEEIGAARHNASEWEKDFAQVAAAMGFIVTPENAEGLADVLVEKLKACGFVGAKSPDVHEGQTK